MADGQGSSFPARSTGDAAMETVRPEDVAGLVLAGGHSSRMGREKAWIEVHGEPLLVRQTRMLRDIGIDRIFLSLRRDMHWTEPGVVVVRDEVVGQGPLAGIAAALAHAPDRHILVLAVDMPRVAPDHLRTLLAEATGDKGVVPVVGAQWEPLCALYPPGIRELLESHLAGPLRSPSALVDELVASGRMRPACWPVEVDVFRSWNRPEDVR